MSWDQPTQEEFDNAVIEDTVHCDVCKVATVLGGNDGVVLERGGFVCIECAAEIHKAYQEHLENAGICEHGVTDGDWCEPCRDAYRQARVDNGDEEPTEKFKRREE
jgi:hypothetical protein